MSPVSLVLVGSGEQENLALGYLAAAAQAAGHRVHILKFDTRNETHRCIQSIMRIAPEVVGLGISFQYTVDDYLSLARVLRARGFGGHITSDTAPLNKIILRLLEVGGIVAMKDPTRGGLSNALNEWREKSKVGILVEEEKIPIREDVQAACEMLGIDPLEVGNEGKIIIGVVPRKAEEVLATLRQTQEGTNAQIIGEVTDQFRAVVLQTIVGGKRILTPPIGDPVPRIC